MQKQQRIELCCTNKQFFGLKSIQENKESNSERGIKYL